MMMMVPLSFNISLNHAVNADVNVGARVVNADVNVGAHVVNADADTNVVNPDSNVVANAV